MAGTNCCATIAVSSLLSTKVSMRRSATFFTLRISFTCDVRAAWGPPLPMAAEISSLYILRRMHVFKSHGCNTSPPTAQQG